MIVARYIAKCIAKCIAKHIARCIALAALLFASSLQADSKLLATSGAQSFEGQAGGGITPWALIAGYGDVGEWGGSLAASNLRLDDFELDVAGIAVSYGNRLEISAARQTLDVAPLGLEIEQDVVSVKARVAGDAIYGAIPAITLGAQHKHNRDFAVPGLLGAKRDSGVDYTASIGKLWLNGMLGRNVFTNLTLRHTEANQTGLLGFGSTDGSGDRLMVEAAAAVFLNRHLAVGLEYRQKPDNLDAVAEDDWMDVFVAWFPSKRVSFVGAYTELGSIAGLDRQAGFFFSLQITQ